jgi:hypothetical protein
MMGGDCGCNVRRNFKPKTMKGGACPKKSKSRKSKSRKSKSRKSKSHMPTPTHI